jgi:subtilase family serine protease
MNVLLLVLSLVLFVGSAMTYHADRATPTHVVRGPMHPVDKRGTSYGLGLTPTQFKTIYNMSTSPTAGQGKTIGIVGAYAHPRAVGDLATFSSLYRLPPCTIDNGCFTRVNQTGGTTYTTNTDLAWAVEANLDLQWAHAIAPGAKLLYVEAASNSATDLFPAIKYASEHADYVSMSFAFADTSAVLKYEYIFTVSGVSFFAASGDDGGVKAYPSTSPNVVAVGGTTLYTNPDDTFSSETGWSSGGGGCSQVFKANENQRVYSSSLCGNKRAVPDVAIVADPNSGVVVYTSEGCAKGGGRTCYQYLGGTSLSSPVMAARAAVRGVVVDSAFLYGGNVKYRDITMGNNGFGARNGYDLVTGLGVWIGDLLPKNPSSS